MPTAASFRERVLNVVAAIPRGHVMSYREVARRAGSPGAARAVGTIMKSNLDPAIPCHRVVRSDGQPGDYNRGGSKMKRALLAAEGATFEGGRQAVSLA